MRSVCRTILVAVLATVPVQPAQEPRTAPQASGTAEALLLHPEVQTELKLNGQQIEKIDAIRRVVRENHKEDFNKLRNLGVEERRRQEAALSSAVSQEIMTAVREVLQPVQAKRLEQVHLQRQGLRAFGDPQVEKALRLTDEQKAKLKIVAEDTAKEVRALFSPRARNAFPEALKKVEALRKTAVEKSVALLTDEQRKLWREMIGDPFGATLEQPHIRQPEEPDGNQPLS
jgi:hypothetical protein